MKDGELLNIILEKGKKIINEIDTLCDKTELIEILYETIKIIMDNKYNTDEILNNVLDEYFKSVKAISKLSPALSTGLRDIKKDITINSYTGYVSDKENSKKITKDTPFDIASITKFLTAILLLKEEEEGNIDLSKPFSFYSSLLEKIDVPIYDALRFGVELRTNGRLDEEGISKEQRIERFRNVYIYDRHTFIYSDIPYMIVLLMFGNTEEEANHNFIRKMYNLINDIELRKTGYFIDDKTGGILNQHPLKENTETFDPKARSLFTCY